MNKTERHIVQLLAENGYVEVPEIGTLCLHRVPASFDGRKLRAPGMSISFDSDAAVNSEQLVASIARKDAVDTDTAADSMKADIATMRRSFDEDSTMSVGNMGMFSETNGRIEFVQNVQWHAPGYFYPELELSPIVKEKDSKKSLPSYADTDEKREEFLRSLRRTASSAAAIAILAILTFIFTQLPSRNTASQQASIVREPAATSEVKFIGATASKPDPALVLVFNTPADASCEVNPVETVSEDFSTIENKQIPEGVDNYDRTVSDAGYCLVVASLSSEDEAHEFIRTTDTSLSLLSKDGRYRVYAMEGSSYEGLLKDAREAGIFNRYPSAWICKR